VIVVLDGVGVGALPDAALYGDEGANTLGNLARAAGGLNMPVLGGLGLGTLTPTEGLARGAVAGACGRMAARSPGKDSTTGHWELAGVEISSPFETFPQGFPPEITAPFEEMAGGPVLGNRPASGTEIIDELGPEHLATGRLILYTSADSVFQVAAHDDVVAVEELYDLCRRTRALLDRLGRPVLRVIARPFNGSPGAFRRFGRRDFSLPPPRPTVLERLQDRGCPVLGIGKVGDLFCGRGFDEVWKTEGNRNGLELLAGALSTWHRGLVLANLIDFDTLYGHRNDAKGFAGALERFDDFLGREILPALGEGDMLIVTADHGCDPTAASTDHSREYVPLIVAAPVLDRAVHLGTRATFGDVAATVWDIFGKDRWPGGTSFWPEIRSFWGKASPAR